MRDFFPPLSDENFDDVDVDHDVQQKSDDYLAGSKKRGKKKKNCDFTFRFTGDKKKRRRVKFEGRVSE